MSAEHYGDQESLSSILFPINPEAKDAAIEFLGPDPDLLHVVNELQIIDGALWSAIETLATKWHMPEDLQQDFVDGCCVTYLILKAQAQSANMPLPITRAKIVAKVFTELDEQMPVSDAYFLALIDRVEDDDDSFTEVIHDYIDEAEDYMPEERTAFIYGSFALYDLLQKHYRVLDDQPKPQW